MTCCPGAEKVAGTGLLFNNGRRALLALLDTPKPSDNMGTEDPNE